MNRVAAVSPSPPDSSEAPRRLLVVLRHGKAEAVAEFRPHAERACRALYGRPDDARTCVRRVLDAALPLSLEDAERPTPTIAPPPGGRGTTVAPDGRE